jgi:hypothetical protein
MSGEVVSLEEARGKSRGRIVPAVNLRDDAWFVFYLPDGTKLRYLDMPELRVVHWTSEEPAAGEVRYVETDVASLCYTSEENLALPPGFVDCLVPFEHAIKPGGVDKYLLRRQFYEYLNKGLLHIDAKFQVESTWRVEVQTQNILYMNYDRADILGLK